MTQDEYKQDLEKRARAMKKQGWSVEINRTYGYISIKKEREETSFFFQHDEASQLLEEVPDYISSEDYILAMSQGW